jgi:hypothetical protein
MATYASLAASFAITSGGASLCFRHLEYLLYIKDAEGDGEMCGGQKMRANVAI